jgi:lipoyl(octanoyl) transferase
VRALVSLIEASMVATLAEFRDRRGGGPGGAGCVRGGRKIASLGLRVRRGCSYHGLALNVDMDLEPF